MATAEIAKRFTAQDLLRMPEGKGFELVDGQLVEQHMSMLSSLIGGNIYLAIASFVKAQGLGYAMPDGTAYQCFGDDEDRVRRPDASFLSSAKVRPGQVAEWGFIPVAPDLAIEVVSPNDLAYEVMQKTREYLEAGCRLVWTVYPDTRSIMVYRADGTVAHLHEKDAISGEDVLPGFAMPVAEIFRVPGG